MKILTFLKKYILKAFTAILAGAFISGLFLLYSQNFSLIGFIDAFSFSSLTLFFLGWILFAANHNVFDMFTYGVKHFIGAFSNRRPEVSYYDYISNKKAIPKYIYRYFWFASLILTIITIVIYVIYKTH